MAEKCEICGKRVDETFLGKLKGTSVTIKRNDGNKIFYICNECQKTHKNLKEKLAEK